MTLPANKTYIRLRFAIEEYRNGIYIRSHSRVIRNVECFHELANLIDRVAQQRQQQGIEVTDPCT